MHRAEFVLHGYSYIPNHTIQASSHAESPHEMCEDLPPQYVSNVVHVRLTFRAFPRSPRISGSGFDVEIGFPAINRGLAIDSYSILRSPAVRDVFSSSLRVIRSHCHHSLTCASHHHHNHPLVGCELHKCMRSDSIQATAKLATSLAIGCRNARAFLDALAQEHKLFKQIPKQPHQYC